MVVRLLVVSLKIMVAMGLHIVTILKREIKSKLIAPHFIAHLKPVLSLSSILKKFK